MYLFDNPVMQRELLVNLRMPRAFMLLLVYQVVLAAVVFFAWPQDNIRLDLSSGSTGSSQLVNLFFLGQYILACLMTPSFAAGAITGEKERKTYEMLLASPVDPRAIVMGKLVAALTHIGVLIFSSLPIVMLCLPLGGVSFYEVVAAYLALLSSVLLFGMISVATGSFFSRTSASLVVSYLVILPLAIAGILFWASLSNMATVRYELSVTVIPGMAIAFTIVLFYITSSRMLYPPDVGSEGKEVVDLETEAEQAIGVVIQSDQFPDRLFAPPKRESLMPDNTNPVYDKEMRSEIFGQGTLMLRLAIQISMLLAIPLMAVFLYINRHLAPFYLCYVLLFNVLIGPVFSAGSVSSERERQTLDLLLTTLISPWQILWGKLLSGLRVASVLSCFLLWPLFLAVVFVPDLRNNLLTVCAFLVIFVLTCVTTSVMALFFSTLFRKTSTSLMVTYIALFMMYVAPVAASQFASTYAPGTPAAEFIRATTVISPFAAAFEFPLFIPDNLGDQAWQSAVPGVPNLFGYALRDLVHFLSYFLVTLLLNIGLFFSMLWKFRALWRVSTSTA